MIRSLNNEANGRILFIYEAINIVFRPQIRIGGELIHAAEIKDFTGYKQVLTKKRLQPSLIRAKDLNLGDMELFAFVKIDIEGNAPTPLINDRLRHCCEVDEADFAKRPP